MFDNRLNLIKQSKHTTIIIDFGVFKDDADEIM